MIKFGTGGWRAVIADGFTKDNIRRLVQALCDIMNDDLKTARGVCIGYDRRFLSREAAQWAAEVFAGNGVPCRVIDQESPTPLIMFTVKQLGLEYGMAVTASHNPAIYNGIKLFTYGGRDASKEVTDRVERHIESVGKILSLPYASALEKGEICEINPRNAYIDSILASVDVDEIKDAQLKVVLDPMYGVSQTCLQTILLTARCEVSVIHERRDTLFGGRLPAPNAETLGALKAAVTDSQSDLGIATDGDADRLGVIDDEGRFVHPNRLMVLLYYYLLAYRGMRGAAVRNNSTTHMLDRIAESFGERCYEVPVGFKYISAKMQETGAVIGGESSGGLTVKGHIAGKDGIYAAALLVEMVAVTGKRLSQLYGEITERYGESYIADADFSLANGEEKRALAHRLLELKELPEFPYEIERVSYQDGCKVYFKNGGWVIARFSGTEPKLRLSAEMDSASAAGDCIERFEQALSLEK